jgi:hypothetical protein
VRQKTCLGVTERKNQNLVNGEVPGGNSEEQSKGDGKKYIV